MNFAEFKKFSILIVNIFSVSWNACSDSGCDKRVGGSRGNVLEERESIKKKRKGQIKREKERKREKKREKGRKRVRKREKASKRRERYRVREIEKTRKKEKE